jgi:hypothetical protein
LGAFPSANIVVLKDFWQAAKASIRSYHGGTVDNVKNRLVSVGGPVMVYSINLSRFDEILRA